MKSQLQLVREGFVTHLTFVRAGVVVRDVVVVVGGGGSIVVVGGGVVVIVVYPASESAFRSGWG